VTAQLFKYTLRFVVRKQTKLLQHSTDNIFLSVICLGIVQAVKKKMFGVDRAYYLAKSKLVGPLIVHDRDCFGCVNKLMRCDVISANVSIIIELLALEFTIDTEVSVIEKRTVVHNVK